MSITEKKSNMTTYKRNLVLLVLMMYMLTPSKGQEADFSMYQYTPLLTNPGMLSIYEDMEASINYRNQSVDIGENFQTSMLSLFYPVDIGQHRFVFAGSFLNDQASDFLSTNGGLLGVAYSIKLSRQSELSLGIQWGYFQRKSDGDFTTDEQFVNGGFDPNVFSEDTGSNLKKGYPALSQGLYWRLLDVQQGTRAFLGISLFNSTRPDIAFFEEEDTLPLSVKTVAGYKVYQGMKIAVSPTVRWVHQAGQDYFNIGTRIGYELGEENGKKQIGLGLFYNTNDLGIVSIEFSQPEFTLAASYDFPVSTELNAARNGTAELTASFRMKK